MFEMTALTFEIQNDRYSFYFCSSLTAATHEDKYFQPFDESMEHYSLPEKFTYPFHYTPHPLCLLAAEKLQHYLGTQTEWEHNFGLRDGQEGAVIGKMFGVLVVKNTQGKIGYLAAFSGKLAGGYHHGRLVPPVFDALTGNSFLNIGMTELTRINREIKALQENAPKENAEQIASLKQLRKNNSAELQDKLYDEYHFLNQAGEVRNLRDIFRNTVRNKPSSGAGDCAAPKLLQYAFQHRLQPLAMAEFWWGLSPKSDNWKHGHFYPACTQKCEPILSHMLHGIAMDERPE